MNQRELVLLGRWPETPLIAWPGFCDVAQRSVADICPVRLEPFTLLREGLHEQYFLGDSVEPLRSWFSALDDSERGHVGSAIYDRYYRDAAQLDEFVVSIAAENLSSLSDVQLNDWALQWMQLPGRLAGPIWFALFLDMWFPDQVGLEGVVQRAAAARDHCANVYDVRGKPEAMRLFGEVASRLQVDLTDLEQLFPEEIMAWLLRGVDYSPKVEARREFFVTLNVDGRYSILEGEAAGEQLTGVVLSDLGVRQDHLEGLPAYGGHIVGTARRILSPTDFEKLRDGEILVSYQTSVSYEPLFERAAAVVTELGGATSHAAVVCAERQIPCVVGVSNLMSSVSDGDRLRIDADRGSVEVERSE